MASDRLNAINAGDQVETGDYNGWFIVAFRGPVDGAAADRFGDAVRERLARGHIHTAIDLVEVDAVTAEAVAIVACARQWLRSLGGHLAVCGARRDLATAFGAAFGEPVAPCSLADVIACPPCARPVEHHMAVGLPPTAAAAKAARGYLARALDEWHCSVAVDAVLLAANELVTNAVVHARAPFEIRLDHTDDHVRVAVVDSSFREVQRRIPTPTATSGRGLSIVDGLSDRFGVDELDGGKAVWFEVDLP